MRSRRFTYAAVVLAAISYVSVAVGTGLAARDSSAARLAFGVHLPGVPEQGSGALQQVQAVLGRQISVVEWYQQWGGSTREPNLGWLDAAAAGGRTPLLTWEPWVPPADGTPQAGRTADQPDYSLARIADGAYDGYVLAFARALARWDKPIYLRPMHEMNGTWYPWGGMVNGNSASDYRRAWRHLHELFVEAGARNVRWVFCVNAEGVPAWNRFESYYPGRRYVDVLAVDGYNWGSDYPQYGGWRGFDAIFHSAYERLARLGNQPIWITEVASAPEGGDKAAWIRDMFTVADSARYRRLEALVWFDADKERDWRAASSAAAAAAFAG